MASETDQILRSHNPDAEPKQIDPKWRAIYEQLLTQKDQLIDTNRELQSKARENQPDSLKNEPGEVGSESYERDYALGMSSAEQELLTEIDAALQRIESGTYGKCEITGGEIPLERLQAVPWTRYSVEGQRQLEERGEATRAGIGPLGTTQQGE